MTRETAERKTLTDRWKVEHEWICEPWASRKAVTMLARVAQIVLGGEAGNLDTLMDDTLPKLRAAISGGGMSGLGGLAARLLGAGGGDFIHELLKGCVRTGRDNLGAVTYTKLADATIFDNIGRGNLKEITEAAWWVLEVNYAPLFLDDTETSADASESGSNPPDSTTEEAATPA